MEAIEAMLGALEDPASRKLIELGMTLAGLQSSGGTLVLGPGSWNYADGAEVDAEGTAKIQDKPHSSLLDDVKTGLEAQLNKFDNNDRWF